MEENSPENYTRAGWPNCRVPDAWKGPNSGGSTALHHLGLAAMFAGGLAIVLAMGCI